MTSRINLNLLLLLLTISIQGCQKHPEEDVGIYTWVYSYRTDIPNETESCLDHDDKFSLIVPKSGKIKLNKNGEEFKKFKKNELTYTRTSESEVTVNSWPFENENYKSFFVNERNNCSEVEQFVGSYEGVFRSNKDVTIGDTSYTRMINVVPISFDLGCFIQTDLDNFHLYVSESGIVRYPIRSSVASIQFKGDSLIYERCWSCGYGQYGSDFIKTTFRGKKVN